jgi:cytochrome c biogenesis protein CcmG, thiol:disulfide interchange protein DsbE
MFKIRIAIICLSALLVTSLALPQDQRPPWIGTSQIEQATPWIGISLDQGYKGVLINGVMPGTPGDEAGLAVGDEVIAVDSKKVTNPNEFGSTVRSFGVGAFIELHLLRKGVAQTKRIKLAARPDTLEMLNKQLLGKPLPAFNLKPISGGTSGASESFKDKVMLIEFWATWCGPCRLTHPRLSEFARANKDKALVVIGISDEDEATVRGYIKKEKLDFLMLNDPSHATQEKFFIMVLPTFVVVNKKGMIVSTGVGGGYYLDEVLNAAEKALQEK